MSARYTGGLVYNAPGGWSGQFSGTNYLTVPSGASVSGTGDFTIECWIFLPALSATYQNLLIPSAASNAVYIDFNNSIIDIGRNNVGADLAASYALPTNTWFHIAFCRASSTMRIFVNGNQVGSGTVTTNYTASGFNIAHSSNGVNGYISNFRVVQGTAVYTAAFTPPTGALQPITNTSLLTCAYPTFVDGSANAFTLTATGATVNTLNPFPTSQLPNPALGNAANGVYTMSQYAALKAANLWPAYDPYYRNVTLNLHGNGTNAAQNNTFLDSSTNNFTITRNGNTTQGTFTPYGSNWSNYFDGSGDYLTFPSNATFAFGTGDFTVEFWVNETNWNPQGGSNFAHWISINSYLTGVMIRPDTTGTAIQVYVGATLYSFTITLALGTWYHIALSRSSSSMRLFVNGSQVGSTQTVSYNILTNTSNTIGTAVHSTTEVMQGYLSNLRIVSGSAVYTSNFTPSTTPLTAITNTSLLTCQSNRFIDNSTNNFTITKNGDTSVQRFSPFSPTTAYSTSVIGGSGYFDGTGDYLTLANNAAFQFSGDFTIECFVYSLTATGGSNYSGVFDTRSGNVVSSASANINFKPDGYLNIYVGGTNAASSTLLGANQWVHVAMVRSGSTVTLYQNGVSVATVTTSANLTDGYCTIGGFISDGYWNGYISNTRVVKGTAVYTSAFTPPTAPLTAITNTSLLLSYTNAGILDNAMMNDLETVGNAQISTSVKKYGTGSMYFDGTGDGLQAVGTPNTVFGTGDFTVEFWVYLNASTGTFKKFTQFGTSGSCFTIETQSTTNVLTITDLNTTVFITSSSALNLTTWTHVAATRSGTTLRLFQNGTQVGSATNSTNFANSGSVYIGQSNSGQAINAYMDDIRVTKGVARYTANFTPPTSQVQDQ